MQRIAFQGKTTAGQWIGGFAGAFIATSIVPIKNPISNVLYPLSIPVGILIGYFITDRWIDVDLYSLEAREFLESRSEYFDRK